MQFVQNHQSSNTTASAMGNVSTAPPSPKAPYGARVRAHKLHFISYTIRGQAYVLVDKPSFKHHQVTPANYPC